MHTMVSHLLIENDIHSGLKLKFVQFIYKLKILPAI